MRITKDTKRRALKYNYAKCNVWAVDDIKRLHRGHFFSPDTMRFFSSRLIQDAFPTNNGLVYFVTSEKACFNDPSRVYNVRCYDIKADSFTKLETSCSKAYALTWALDFAYKATMKETAAL